MPEQRGTITEQLDQILQVLNLGEKTGVLRIKRENDATREEGLVNFFQGHITEAHVFFIDQITNSQIGYIQGERATSWLRSWTQCRFIFEQQAGNEAPDVTSILSDMKRVTQPVWDSNHMFTPPPIAQSGTDYHSTGSFAIPFPPIIPYRIRTAAECIYIMNNSDLSRNHKRLFLLIDGQRTIQELARLLGNNPASIHLMLQDLRTIGIIDY